MKTECMYCGKIITDPFIDTDNIGRLYFFCNKEHKDNYQEFLIRRTLMTNPIGAFLIVLGICWGFIKALFQQKPTIR